MKTNILKHLSNILTFGIFSKAGVRFDTHQPEDHYSHDGTRKKKFRPTSNRKGHRRRYKQGGTTNKAASTSPQYYPWTKQRPLKDRIFYHPPKGMYKKGKSGGLERKAVKVGRNELCPCGKIHDFIYTGVDGQEFKVSKRLKHKFCCLNKNLFFKQAS